MLYTKPTQATPEQESGAAREYERAALLGRLDQYEQALRVYEMLIEQHPQDALAYTGKGNMLLFLKRPTAALVAYTQALTLAPVLSPAWVGKACALKALQQAKAAVEAYDQAIALDLTCAPAYFGKAELLLERNHPWQALKSYRRGFAAEQAHISCQDQQR